MANASVNPSPDATGIPHVGGMTVGMGDGSVRNAPAPPAPPAGPTPIPYPNVETAPGASGESGYLLTSVQHTARDASQSSEPTGPAESDFLFGGEADAATYFNGFVSRFSAGGRDAYEGAHALYQDVVIPTGQVSDGTSNTIMFAEQVPAHEAMDVAARSDVGDFAF